jgi:hypothetical protein
MFGRQSEIQGEGVVGHLRRAAQRRLGVWGTSTVHPAFTFLRSLSAASYRYDLHLPCPHRVFFKQHTGGQNAR